MGAPGKQKPKLFPIISYIRGQTLKPSASPANVKRKPGSNQSMENGLEQSQNGLGFDLRIIYHKNPDKRNTAKLRTKMQLLQYRLICSAKELRFCGKVLKS